MKEFFFATNVRQKSPEVKICKLQLYSVYTTAVCSVHRMHEGNQNCFVKINYIFCYKILRCENKSGKASTSHYRCHSAWN